MQLFEEDVLMIMESMKMEQVIVATSNGKIKKINVNAGDTVEVGLVMIVIES